MKNILYLSAILVMASIITQAAPSGGTLEFIENKGQWPEAFLYKSISAGGTVYLEQKGITYVIGAADNYNKIHEAKEGKTNTAQILKFHSYKVLFEDALTPIVTGTKIQPHYYNYFLGKDPSKWKSGIHPNYTVDYAGIYKDVDLHISSVDMKLKYDFIIKPGASPSDIKLKFTGVDGLSIKDGKLFIKTSVGTIEELAPYAYQYIDGNKKEINCSYKISGNTVSYHLPKGYNAGYPLIIDPTVIFATFTGSTADNWGFTATYDNAGNLYAGGGASGPLYPVTTGAYNVVYSGGGTCGGNSGFPSDITITKFNAAGTALIYSTYIGGSESDQPHSLVVDNSGNLVLAGRTCSVDYPTTGGAFSSSNKGGSDIVVTSLNSTGTALVGSTYIGGNADDGMNISGVWGVFNNSLKHSYGDDARSEVLVDNSGNIYVAACSKSTNFPVANATQSTLSGAQDAVAFKLNSTLSTLTWSTYIGGTQNDAAYVLALDGAQGSIYVSGGTGSSNFPMPAGGLSPTYKGGIADGYILKYQNSGTYTLQGGTFIGESSYDQCYGIQIDRSNNVYVMGQTLGGLMTATAGTYSNPGSSQFIMKLNGNLNTKIFSTVYGSGNSSAVNITPVAFLVDTCENIYISGWGGSLAGSGGNASGMPINLGSPAPSLVSGTTNGEDFYFIALSRNATALLFGGYYGSPTVGDHVDGGTSRFDKNGVIYQALCGGCGGVSNVPTSPGVWSNTNRSNNCNLAAFKMAFNLGAVNASASISPNRVLCLGEAATFTNGSTNATSYEWNFGDGSPVSTAMTPPPHVYATPGTFTVRLTIYNPTACVERDTSFLTVVVDTNSIKSNLRTQIIDTCFPYQVSFTNTSKYGKNPGSATFVWNFGDGTSFTGTTPPNKKYAKAGTYTVTLIMTDPTACNNPDSASSTIKFRDDVVKAVINIPELICVGDSFRPFNHSENALTYLWYFGDGKTSTVMSPAHKYDSAGNYSIKLLAYNPTSCNRVDSTSRTISVKNSPTANFTFTPLAPVLNDPSVFTNKSADAVKYKWNFGDGTGTEETHPTHFYKKTGTYTVCLVALNELGCTDTICKNVSADVLPLADLPNGFSPNGDGKNDILYVRGAAIEKIDLKIYNRWGQLVFESKDVKDGWDGTYKGKPQEMEAYAYVLNVTFIDETTFYKRGNVTLLR